MNTTVKQSVAAARKNAIRATFDITDSAVRTALHERDVRATIWDKLMHAPSAETRAGLRESYQQACEYATLATELARLAVSMYVTAFPIAERIPVPDYWNECLHL